MRTLVTAVALLLAAAAPARAAVMPHVAAPLLTLTVPANVDTHDPIMTGTATGGTGPVSVDVHQGSTVGGVIVSTSAGGVADGAFAVPVATALPDGTYTAVASQSDGAGGSGQSPPRTFVVDTVVPVVSLAAPVQYNPTTLSGTAEDGIVKLGINLGLTLVSTLTTTASGGAYTANLPSLADGAYSVVAQETDAAGNTGTSTPRIFDIDTTPPDITITGLQPVYAFGVPVNLAFNCTDAVSGVATCAGPPSIDAAPGTHDVTVTATDKAGNAGSAHAQYVVSAPLPDVTPTPTPEPTATPTPTPTPVAAHPKSAAKLKFTSAKARRKGRTVTLTLRGRSAGTGRVRIAVLTHHVTVKLTRSAWKATLKFRTARTKLTVRIAYGGDSAHRAGSLRRTVSVR